MWVKAENSGLKRQGGGDGLLDGEGLAGGPVSRKGRRTEGCFKLGYQGGRGLEVNERKLARSGRARGLRVGTE